MGITRTTNGSPWKPDTPTEWIDEFGLTWLAVAPKIRLLPDTQKRQPYPLSRDEQVRLLRE